MNTLPRQRPRVVLIDDHAVFRAGLRHVLEREGGLTVVSEAATYAEAMDLCAGDDTFDLALIDYQLESKERRESGLDVLRTLHECRPEAKVILLTGGLPSDALLEAVRQYRAGIFFKSEPVSELLDAIQRTLLGAVAISSKATDLLVELAASNDAPALPATFSDRERLVLRCITEGLANKEIAAQMQTTETNVKAILQRLFEKTGVRSRGQLVRYVFEFNLELP